MPIFEHILGFDPLEDIEYEISSAEKHGQRFDFLLRADGDLSPTAG